MRIREELPVFVFQIEPSIIITLSAANVFHILLGEIEYKIES